MNQSIKRVVRSLLQFAAGGGLTALTAAAVDGLSPETAGLLTVLYGTGVSALQNVLEDIGWIPSTK